MTSLKISKFNFSATISIIDAQFAPVNKGLNSTSIWLQLFFRKYFRFARMTSLNFSKFNFTVAVNNIYAQFAPMSRGLYSAYFMLKHILESTSCMQEWRHKKLQSSPLLLAIFMRTFRQ